MIRCRIIPLIACLISVALCFGYAATRQTLPEWWAMNGGGVPYVLFWIMFFYFLIPSPRHILHICIAVVLGTCLLEVGQLWNPEPIASFRKTKFGAALLGTTFVWQDFPPYFIGGVAGYLVLVGINYLRPTSAKELTYSDN